MRRVSSADFLPLTRGRMSFAISRPTNFRNFSEFSEVLRRTQGAPPPQSAEWSTCIVSIKMPLWLRIFLVIVALILAAASGLFGYRYYTHPLTVAVGSIDSEASKAMSAIASHCSWPWGPTALSSKGSRCSRAWLRRLAALTGCRRPGWGSPCANRRGVPTPIGEPSY